MKRIFVLITALLTVISLASCNSSSNGVTDESKPDETVLVPEVTADQVEETDTVDESAPISRYPVFEVSCYAHNDGMGYSETCYKFSDIHIKVEVVNKGAVYGYRGSPSDLFGPSCLYLTSDTQTYSIECQPFVNTADITERSFECGDSASYTFVFKVSEDTPSGVYRLEFPFAETVQTVEAVFELKNFIEEDVDYYLRQASHKALLDKRPSVDVEKYRVTTIKHDSGDYSVLYIGLEDGIVYYRVDLEPDLTVKNVAVQLEE